MLKVPNVEKVFIPINTGTECGITFCSNTEGARSGTIELAA